MTDTFSGTYFDDRENGVVRIGADINNVGGVGALILDAGSSLDLTAADFGVDREQILFVGATVGANGTVEVGPGSTLELTSSLDDTASRLIIGRGRRDGSGHDRRWHRPDQRRVDSWS